MVGSSSWNPPSGVVALLALDVVVKFFPGPAALILSWSCDRGSPGGFQSVVGFSSVSLQLVTVSCRLLLCPARFPSLITLLVEAVVWFCSTLYRGYITPYRAVYGRLFCMGLHR